MVRGKHLFFLALLSLVVLFTGSLVPTTTFAKSTQVSTQHMQQLTTYGLPYWWNRYHCDSGNNSNANPNPITTWNGIEVCQPLPGKSNLVPVVFPSGEIENEFQCTELVKRFIYLEFPGLKTLGSTNGSQVVDNYTNPTMEPGTPFNKVINDGRVHMTPQAGDILSYAPSAANYFAGHTSIVTGVNADGSINVIQQNILWNGSYLATDTLKISNFVIQPSTKGAGSVISWMTTRPYPPTTVNFSVTMPGIGNISGNNNNPRHPQRSASVQILNGNGGVVNTISTTVTYSSSSGAYSGSVTLSLPAGSYTVSVKLSNSLSKQLPGFFTVPTATWSPGGVALVSGDINNDNVLDILDYNDLLSCYGNKFSTCQFNPGADLNDDGAVDGADYNIWLRDMQTQSGG